MLNSLLFIVASFLVGLVLGMERERSHPEGKVAIGVRTFILFALLGTVAAILKQSIITATTAAFVFGIILIAYYQRASKHKTASGFTTELSAGMIFIIGYMLPAVPLLAITISAIVLFVLIERKRLHIFSRYKIIPQEIEAIILITVLSVGILPILPNKTIDPWGFFNPQKFVFLILIIVIMQFLGYIAVRIIGQRIGRALLGFFGGLVSSTAVFATLPQMLGRGDKQFWTTQAAAILAVTASIVEIGIVILLAAPKILSVIQWPLVMMMLSSMIIAMYLLHYQNAHFEKQEISNVEPVDFKYLIKTVFIMATIFFILALTKKFFSTTGIYITSLLTGLFELHGVTLATALLYSEKQLIVTNAGLIICIAIFGSIISKYILLWSLSPRRFAIYNSLYLTLIWLSGAAALFLTFP